LLCFFVGLSLQLRMSMERISESLAEKTDVEVDLDHSPFRGERLDHIIAQIPRRIAQSAATGMRGEHRRLTRGEHIDEHFVGDMRYVHDHSQPVHFADHLFAEGGQPVMNASVRRRICPFDVHIVSKRHISDAERGVCPQGLQAAVNHLAAFDRQKNGNSPIEMGLPDLSHFPNEPKIFGMTGHFPTNGIDLAKRTFDGLRAGYFARLPNRKKNRSDSAIAHSRDVNAPVAMARRQVKMIEYDALRGVYMRVHNHRPKMKVTRFYGASRRLIFTR
jgi:hypothetical protein